MRITPSTRVLVTGGSGSLGWVLARMLAARCLVTSTYLTHPQVPDGTTGLRLDLGEPSSAANILRSAQPHIVVHSAAASDPDACERDPESAFRINFEATRGLALLAREVGSRVIFISTDLVFDGAKGNYSEQDQPCPLGVYAASKLRAEAAILEAGDPDLVLRSALIYGFAGPVAKTFLGRMLETLAGGCRIHLFTDQRRSPVLVDDLARGIILAIEQDLSGLYHLGGAEAVSRYEFGQQACRVFGCNEELLVPASQEDFALPAPRPLDATLDSGKFARATGFVPCGVGEGLDLAKRGRASIV